MDRYRVKSMMRNCLLAILLFGSYAAFSQEPVNDSAGVNIPTQMVSDSTAFLDSIMREMDEVIAALTRPESFLSASIGGGTGFFNFKSSSTQSFTTEKKVLLSPFIGYFHRSGIGLSATGYAISEQGRLNGYQLSVTGSYDIVRYQRLSAGAAYAKYFTRENLSFYTTPVVNEAYAYFNYRRPWLQPGVAVSYGWGSRTEYEKRRLSILRLRRLRDPGYITVSNEEAVREFSMLLSVRHDFDWTRIFGKNDILTITPVLLMSTGTQHFGFNTSFQSQSKTVSNFLPGNRYISDNTGFDTQSATAVIRADYSSGKFFLQSQILFDYFLHAADDRFNNAAALIVGVNL